jgi:hypothetical protein
MAYSFAHFNSVDYERYFESIVKTRLTRTTSTKSITSLFRRPTTVTSNPRKPQRDGARTRQGLSVQAGR